MFAKKFLRDERGSSAIEFAFTFPPLLGLILGILYFGMVNHSMQNVRFGLTEGARALQLNPTMSQSTLQTLVRSRLVFDGDVNSVVVTLAMASVGGGTQVAKATATYPVDFTVPLVGSYSATYSVTVTVPVL